MKKNIITLIFLALMISAAVFAVITYNKLQEEKNKSQKLADKLDKTLQTNDNLKDQADSITRELTRLLSTANPTQGTDKKWDTEKTTLIQELKSVNETYTKVNHMSAYQQAYEYEKQGFEALVKNDFETALSKLSLAEKTSSGFHMTYEISGLLKANKKEFNNPETRASIKKQIIEKYSWKAPAALLKILKSQVAGPAAETKDQPAVKTLKWPVKKTH